ncbi:hypothetical protein SBI_08516 [Streptomyces bingchenggensis BCW-1]|uniref:Uncharacterized protein n=1 Tax=Streptomyces bingchenggensis (strain BCW-1) TaxID=749414 RepID=D7BU85_STRBB|nr:MULTISPECIES: hypothetical protein [Streptomyces]ADI11634.1 hypothetical protein SBI_08516 [Streptomyces bingchenggensis BCW-1]
MRLTFRLAVATVPDLVEMSGDPGAFNYYWMGDEGLAVYHPGIEE